VAATIYEIVDVQNQDAQQILNVFHYVDPAGSTDIAGLLDNYIDDVLPLVIQMQSNALTHTSLRYRQVYPTASLQLERTISSGGVGLVSGEWLSTFFAASGKWILGNPTVNLVGGSLPHIKRGGVRLAGVVETGVVEDAFVSGYVTAFAAWVAELLNPGVGAFELCVASFLNASRVRQSTVQQYCIPTAASAPSPSTQNTRKVLRGRSS